jgi:hypothetical protein
MARMVGNSGCSSPPCVVQHGSTATPPDSPELARTPAHRDSWDDGQTPSGAASSGRRGRRFKSGHPRPRSQATPPGGTWPFLMLYRSKVRPRLRAELPPEPLERFERRRTRATSAVTSAQHEAGRGSQRFINAKTPQPRYSRRYRAYRAGLDASSARISSASSSSGLASSQRRMLSHDAAA